MLIGVCLDLCNGHAAFNLRGATLVKVYGCGQLCLSADYRVSPISMEAATLSFCVHALVVASSKLLKGSRRVSATSIPLGTSGAVARRGHSHVDSVGS